MAERPVLPEKAVDGEFAGDRETHRVVACTSSAAQVTRRTVELAMISACEASRRVGHGVGVMHRSRNSYTDETLSHNW